MKENKRHNIILTIIVTLVTILVGIVVGFGINEFFDVDNYIEDYEDNYEEDLDDLADDVIDELEDNIVDEEENLEVDKLITKKYKISENNLFVDDYEKQYREYSRLTELTVWDGLEYYIKNGILYRNSEGVISEVFINGEKPKYLAVASDCGGANIIILTEKGNIYGFHAESTEGVTLLYSGGDATDILSVNESKIFTTCGEYTIFALVDNKLYSIQDKQKFLKENRFSIAASVGIKTILLYPDGSLNSYVYNGSYENTSSNSEIKEEFITYENNEKILVSFIFSMNDKLYFIDTKGSMYLINMPEFNENSEPKKYTIEKITNNKLENIEYVEVSQKKYSYIIDNLEIYDVKGNKISYSSKDNTLWNVWYYYN